MVYFGGLLVCALIILFAGKKLSAYGDLIAVKTGVGKAFIGLFLMSAVTSLPELMVGISSVAIINAPDLATGDVLGSCAFNLMLLVIMDAFTNDDQPLLRHVSKTHVMAASLGVILLSFVGLGLFLQEDIVLTSFLGVNSLSFLAIYFAALWLIYRHQQKHPAEQPADAHPQSHLTRRQIGWRYVLFAIIIVEAAMVSPFFAENFSRITGLNKSFVGTLFLAASTSLPEIGVSIAAVRMNSTDLAVGNVLGSNIFNVFILFVDDVFYTSGHLLKDSSDNNLLTVFATMIMSAIVMIAIIFESPKKRFGISWETLLILLVYVLNLTLLFRLG